MCLERTTFQVRQRMGTLCVAVLCLLFTSACSPLGEEEEAPTPTAGASLPGPTVSPTSSPPQSASGGSPISGPEMSGTPASAPPSASPAPNVPASGDATPVTEATPNARLGSSPGATPQGDEVPDTTVEDCDPEEIPPFEGDDPNYVTTVDVNFRVGPGQECDRIGDAPLAQGREVVVLSEPVTRDDDGQQWVQVEVDGETGWVAAEFIEPVE